MLERLHLHEVQKGAELVRVGQRSGRQIQDVHLLSQHVRNDLNTDSVTVFRDVVVDIVNLVAND